VTYNLTSLESTYNVKLDDTQKGVLSSLINFINGDKQTICLKASAGTGKTMLISMLYDILNSNGYSVTFVTPTNKAKVVAVEKGNKSRNATTIHSLLKLKPSFDILNFDARQLKFLFGGEVDNHSYDVLLVDECSMINDDLYETLCKKYSNCKIVFVGDPKQLAPVKQSSIAKSFQCSEQLTLDKVYRQHDSVVYRTINELRKHPINRFESKTEGDDSIIVYNDIKKMLNDYGYLFRVRDNLDDCTIVKIIAYTNRRIGAINDYMRHILYNDDIEYHVGEILTGCDTCQHNNTMIENSKDYVVDAVIPYTFSIRNINLNAFKLRLKVNELGIISSVILSKNNDKNLLKQLSLLLENKRQEAIRSKSKAD
jgi:hypothetical protein